jgi:hypothetical protein
MIGCVAKAQSYEVLLNASEMEDVQWYDRAELAAAVRWYDGSLPLQEAQKRAWAQLGFWIPPPFAIAHHIIRAWALRDGARGLGLGPPRLRRRSGLPGRLRGWRRAAPLGRALSAVGSHPSAAGSEAL